jgi:hypothetical protein
MLDSRGPSTPQRKRCARRTMASQYSGCLARCSAGRCRPARRQGRPIPSGMRIRLCIENSSHPAPRPPRTPLPRFRPFAPPAPSATSPIGRSTVIRPRSSSGRPPNGSGCRFGPTMPSTTRAAFGARSAWTRRRGEARAFMSDPGRQSWGHSARKAPGSSVKMPATPIAARCAASPSGRASLTV